MTGAILDDRQRRALTSFSQTWGRSGLSAPALPSVTAAGTGDVQAFVGSARQAVAAERQRADAALAEAQTQAASRQRGSEDDAALKRLEAAVAKLENELRAPGTLRNRLDEGRRSMMPKVDKLIQQSLEPRIEVQGGTLTARVAPEGMQALAQALPQWVEAWSRYVCGWLDVDLQRVVQEAWTPREGDLPLPPPVLAPLDARAVKAKVDLPELTLDRDQVRLGAGMYRHARTVLYGILSMTFLIGLDRSNRILIVVGVLVALFIGYTQVQAERDREKARMAEDLVKNGKAEVREAVRHSLDRAADRLSDDIKSQLLERRQALVAWYRGEVIPALARREAEQQAAQAAAEQARQALPRAQQRQRDLERLAEELERLAAALV